MAPDVASIDVVRPSSGNHTGTVIFLHGSGSSGTAMVEYMNAASFPHLKIIYPTAPLRPYTLLNGRLSNVWFDRLKLAPNCAEHLETINPMALGLVRLIKEENRTGIPLNRIVVGGLSMGGGMALHVGYRFLTEIAGVFCLSSFLNDNSIIYKELEEKKPKKLPPLFYAHGDRDDLVHLSWGQRTFEQLQKLGVRGVFHTIPHMGHEMTKKEIDSLFEWINELVPNI